MYPLSIGEFSFTSAENEAEVDALFQSNRVIESYGRTYKKSLINEWFFYKTLIFDPVEKLPFKVQEEKAFLSDLLFHLWFAKDCCCGITFTTSHSFEHDMVTRIYPPNAFCKADLSSSTEVFSLVEIQFAYDILLKLVPNRSVFSDDDRDIKYHDSQKGISMISQTTNYNKYNRMERAMMFLNSARVSSSLPEKISFYVLLLECLFSAGDTTELKHRLGERIALYFGNNHDERIRLYNEFSEYYNIRSKYIHGQSIEGYDGKKMVKLYEASIGVDSLVRRILIKIITNDADKFLLPSKGLRDWFNSMLFK
ncbi:HEPN domain-containing protein [Spirosoma liriopis]|nr:HEPN domain-containing protein [Spirosoma liriopis]